jgi:thiol-disulfide isomerase/thioredoxin
MFYIFRMERIVQPMIKFFTSPYGLFLIGILFITLWFTTSMKQEGFASSGTASPGSYSFVMYYAPWCPHCKTVKPAFESWMSSQKLVNAQMKEADKDSADVAAAGVKGFPTFQLTKEDGSVVECGARDAAGWEAFLKENM